MPELSSPTPSSLDSAASGLGLPWSPGVRLLQRAGPWGRGLMLFAAAMAPALPWLVQAAGADAPPRAGWFALLLIPLYALVCAGLAVRRPPLAPAGRTAMPLPVPPPRLAAQGAAAPAPAVGPAAADAGSVQPEPVAAGPDVDPDRGVASPTAPAAGWITDPPEPEPAAAVPAAPVVAAAPPASPLPSESPLPPEPPAPPLSPAPEGTPPAEAALGEARGAADEIGRRVLGSSGLLDSCSKLTDAAQADLEALLDEERYAQKLLSTMRTRLVVLDQRCWAVAQAALQAQADDAGRAEVNRLVQAAQAQVLHCHQLAERLGAVERGHGPRMHSLRRSLDLVAGRIDRVLRDAQQLMKLTRRIAGALGAASPACGTAPARAPAEAEPPAA